MTAAPQLIRKLDSKNEQTERRVCSNKDVARGYEQFTATREERANTADQTICFINM